MKGEVISQKVKLRDLRLEMGLTQQELADSLGMNSRYISMVESGKKPCSEKMVQKVELLAQSKQRTPSFKITSRDECPRCAKLEAELVEARAVIRDQASALAAALAAKPSPAAAPVCGAPGSVHKERRGA